MHSPKKQLLFSGLVIGSVWAFSEVVLGSFLRTTILPIRGFVLTGIGAGILFAGFALTRNLPSTAIAVATTVLARIVFSSSIGSGVSITNGSLAVFLEGTMIFGAIAFIKYKNQNGSVKQGLIAGTAILFSGLLFYTIGIHYDPCPYLKNLTFFGFFFREALPWAVFSGYMAPLGYKIGISLSRRNMALLNEPLPALGTILVCWISCALTAFLIS